MRALARRGDHGAARRYRSTNNCAAHSAKKLGASPSPILAALNVRLLRGGQPG
jgi:hypothetical protein